MQEVTIKKSSDIKVEDQIYEFLNPKFIFLPVKKGYKLKVSDNDYVYKNDVVLASPLYANIYSSVSGRVLGVKEMTYWGNKTISSLVIENDFKENVRKRKGVLKYIGNITMDTFYETLRDISITHRGQSTLSKIKTIDGEIIINAIELEPYFENKNFTLKNHAEEILETVDLIGRLTAAKRIIFAIKNNDSENISELMNIMGTYPNIELKLVSDAYPNGATEVLKKIFDMKSATVLDIVEIYDIYEVLKRSNPIIEKLITIAGDAVKPNRVIKVKIGSLLSEAFTSSFDFTKKNIEVYLNGMMGGEIVNHLKYVIDSNIDGVLVMEKTYREEDVCINCGLCSKHCPMGLNPKYVFDHNGRVKPLYYDKCIQCGLCNYVCPSNMDLKKAMKGCNER